MAYLGLRASTASAARLSGRGVTLKAVRALHSERRFGTNYPTTGTGFLAGEFPSGTTTVEGVPTQAEVRVLWRGPAGHPSDGVLVAKTQSAPDGTWRVDGLNPDLRYDVVGRKGGFNDVIVSNVQPVV